MKRFLTLLLAVFVCTTGLMAKAVITFSKTSHNFGTFSDKKPVTCVFTFTNTGDAPLIVHQALTSCGCTVASYTKEPVLPGKTGTVEVVYDGKGKFPGKMKSAITIRSNAKIRKVLLFIEGNMTGK